MILNVGCGHQKSGDIRLDYSRNRGSQANIIADAHNLPFKSEVFSKVVSQVVLEHSPNPLKFLEEQYRVLKINGEIEVITDNAQYYSWSVMQPGHGGIIHENYHDDHYMIFFPLNVERLLGKASFDSVNFKYIRMSKWMDIFALLLIRLSIWRVECLYKRFRVTAIKKELKNES